MSYTDFQIIWYFQILVVVAIMFLVINLMYKKYIKHKFSLVAVKPVKGKRNKNVRKQR